MISFAVVALTNEKCTRCGWIIHGNHPAFIRNGNIVCERCNIQIETGESVEPFATVRQVKYATDLGLSFPERITCEEISKLIDDKLNSPAPPNQIAEAATLGITAPSALRTKEIDWAIRQRKNVCKWIMSVVRNATQARWIKYSDAPFSFSAIFPIAETIERDDVLSEAVCGIDEGDTPMAFYREMYRRSIEDEDDWFFFGRGGPDDRHQPLSVRLLYWTPMVSFVD